ncbi:rRNA N6-adenosine-methyltransferase METTL5 [Nematocida major]|uniref:rRNA N6-adenosine-methyltransferase METTL5 n=1 Tax=Nematocida major TaxID=1912982 RepID=UPI00200772E6|nr:rRNA N6-adenosine-methyltransferase METTL5 [Nematocida major]KAH9385865.1 rRNA N6-adenosine-methyltransferase METTL5 [Nematocida major]
MKLKHVKWELDGIEGFASPKIRYEQYMTPSELACSVAHVMAVENDDISGKKVLDLGCGTGMLSAAVLLHGASRVTGVDIDGALEETYRKNLQGLPGEGKFRFLRLDVSGDDFSGVGRHDTAVINPPFGTKSNSGIDALFLEKALSIADVVYSMHKTSTREYFQKKYAGRITVLSKMLFELKKTYKFQKKESVHVEVDLIRVISK